MIATVIGIWLYGIYLQPEGKEYISLLLGQETVGRMIKAKTHSRPFYFYFEKLPLIENVELLRNIIYSGIWTKFELIKKKRMEEKS